jgi:hypothetical protein
MNITKKYNPLETFLMSTLFVFQKLNYLIPILLLIVLSINSIYFSWTYPIIAIGGTYLMFQSHYKPNFNIKKLSKNYILKKMFLAWSFFVVSILIGALVISILSFFINVTISFIIFITWISVGVSSIAITNNNVDNSFDDLFLDTFNNYLLNKDVIPLLSMAMFVAGINSILYSLLNENHFIVDSVFVSLFSVIYVYSVLSYYRVNNK